MTEANDIKVKTLVEDHDNLERKLKRQCNIDVLKIRNDTDVEIATLKKDHTNEKDKLIYDQQAALSKAKTD